eukprot:TRINITY_DN838_c0_g1_i1.p2 TRINITY_DN838_c0_g1~~TRINITY_DN838_c0_g1_i1.p2  ORF type:complete len:193 (+),score=53.07 TRINITY_DN838_c0_g1_i1:313-891(+)
MPSGKPLTNKYDPYTLKAAIDDYIIEALTTKQDYVEIQTHSNVKLLLGFIVCSTIALSHFYPVPFPQNYNLIIVCVVAYFILSTLYSLYESRVEKDTFLQARKKSANKEEKLTFDSRIEFFSEFYEFTLTYANNNKKIQAYTEKISVGQIFDEKGYLSEERVDKLLRNAIKEADIKAKQLKQANFTLRVFRY